MSKNKDDLKNLSQIFRDDIKFVIPDYQRGYSWGDKQLQDLWEDLENMPDKGNHYTGMFTFCKNDDNDYYIVDGQQRMTTLIIFINELLNRIKGGIPGGSSVEDYKKKYLYNKPYEAIYIVYKFQYSDDDPSNAYFKTQILGQEDSKAISEPINTLYTQNLSSAKKFFNDKIDGLKQEQLHLLFKKVTEHLLFNEYMIDDINEVYVTFETMNNRGKGLSALELLKNRLIYLTTLYSILEPDNYIQKNNAEELRQNINNTWKTIYEYLGKNVKRTLNDDVFLRDHWIMYCRYDRKSSMVFKDDLLSKTFTAKRVINGELKITEIDEYVKCLGKSVINWYNINCPVVSNQLSEAEEIALTRLNRVGIGSFRPLLMAAYLRKDNDIVTLIDACERFRFLTFNVSGRRSNTEDYHFYTLANDFFKNNNLNISYLISDIEDKTNFWLNLGGFINNAVDRYQKREGFYSWSGLRYFLYEYERSLQNQTRDKDKKGSWELFESNQTNKISIEHIYPQSPQDIYWLSRFTTEEDKALTHSLGNLLLLSVAKNAEQQNDSFDKKKKTETNEKGDVIHNGYDSGSYSEIEVSREVEWTPEKIIERGKRLLGFLKDNWKLNHDFTDEEINKILNISESHVSAVIEKEETDEPDWLKQEDTNDL